MKAWRIEAAAINARRKDGSKEPTARVQKNMRKSIETVKSGSTWLLDGLLIRAGIIDPMPITHNYYFPKAAPVKSFFGNLVDVIRRAVA